MTSAVILQVNITKHNAKKNTKANGSPSVDTCHPYRRKKISSLLNLCVHVCVRVCVCLCLWRETLTSPSVCQTFVILLVLPQRTTVLIAPGLQGYFGVNRVQYVSVIAWVFDFRKFITITDVSLQAMHIDCAPIANICSQHGLTHERYTNYLIPWGVE